MFFVMLILLAFAGGNTKAFAGVDVTNISMNISYTNYNGIACQAVKVYFPTNSFSRSLQLTTDLSKTNNWSGIMLTEYVVKVNYPAGSAPGWSMWIVPTTNANSKLRIFRMTAMLP